MKRGTIEDKKNWLESVGIKFPQDEPEPDKKVDSLLWVAHDLMNALKQVRFCVPPAQRELVRAAIAKAEGVLK